MLPVELILRKLPVAPVGETGTIPYCMQQHGEDFVGAAFKFDTREVVAYQHLGLELVTRTRREMKKLSLPFRPFCLF
jgi:hypothetical protein